MGKIHHWFGNQLENISICNLSGILVWSSLCLKLFASSLWIIDWCLSRSTSSSSLQWLPALETVRWMFSLPVDPRGQPVKKTLPEIITFSWMTLLVYSLHLHIFPKFFFTMTSGLQTHFICSEVTSISALILHSASLFNITTSFCLLHWRSLSIKYSSQSGSSNT